MGRPFTVSMFVQVEQLQGAQRCPNRSPTSRRSLSRERAEASRGGRFGRVVVPQGFLLLVMPAYQKLAAVFKEEIHLGFEEMARIKIEKNRLVLDPREPVGEMPGLPQTF